MHKEEHTSCKFCAARSKSIFCGLGVEETRKIDEVKICSYVKRGEWVFKEGSYPKGLLCVESGKIKVFQIGADGKEQILHLIHDGNVMGHRAIFSEDTYSCSAIAMEDSHICLIPNEDFYKILETSPKLLLKITHLLAVELKEAESKITQMARKPVKERISQVILSLIDNYGFKDDGATINLQVKREDLANLAGTTRETATRVLYELQEQKILALEGKYIKILEEKKLDQGFSV